MDRKPRFWKMSPGKSAIYWNDFNENGFAAIGSYDVEQEEDLGEFKTFGEFWEEFKDIQGSQQVGTFCFKTKKGDILVAYSAPSSIYGIGIITGEYRYKEFEGPGLCVGRYGYEGEYCEKCNNKEECISATEKGFVRCYFDHRKDVTWLNIEPPIDVTNNEKILKKLSYSKTIFELKDFFNDDLLPYMKNERPDIGFDGFLKRGISITRGIKSFNEKLDPLLSSKRQIIFFGPPGTGKTYKAREFAVDFLQKHGGY